MFAPAIFAMWSAGLFILAAGILYRRRELAAAPGLDKLLVLAPVFYAAPLAVFGAEHLGFASAIKQGVPAWMPAHLFWTYLVGCALIATALSFTFDKFVRYSASLCAAMLFLFVLLIHIDNAAANPHDRFTWAVVVRDTAFACGAWTLSINPRLLFIPRLWIGTTAVIYGILHFFYPTFAPVVPLAKPMPPWLPVPVFWGYLAGAVLLISGILLLANKSPRAAASAIGVLALVYTLLLYLPILLLDPQPALVEGINYVFDTLMFSGAALLLAAALTFRLRAAPSIPARQSLYR